MKTPLGWLIAEVARNLRSRPIGAVVMATVRFAVGLLVLLTSAAQVSSAVTLNDELNARGAQVWQVHPAVPMPAAQCEALATAGGVRFSGSVQRTMSGTIAQLPGATARVVFATSGYVSIMWPDAGAAVGAGAGSELFRAYGIRPGQNVAITEIGGQGLKTEATVDRVLASSSRDIQANQTLVLAVSPSSEVSECLVEAEVGASESVDRYLAGQFGAAAITRLYIPDDIATTPDQTLNSRVSIWLPIAGGIILVLIGASQFHARRTDWALYRLLGVSSGRTLVMIIAETIFSVVLPLAAGLSVGIVLQAEALAHPLVLDETGLDVARLLLAIVPLPLVSWLILRRKNVAEWFKGE